MSSPQEEVCRNKTVDSKTISQFRLAMQRDASPKDDVLLRFRLDVAKRLKYKGETGGRIQILMFTAPLEV